MTSLCGDLTPSPNIASLHEKHNLGASGGRGEGDYDCLVPNAVVGPLGSFDNYGIWFDRDGVDPWQAALWGAVNGGTYNTGGIYTIIIHYHAISAGLGSMFATVNGIQTGFYIGGWKNAQPENYPTGLSFKGDMTRMQVFAGMWAPDATYGSTVIHDLTVTGELGVSSPLVADFTYSPSVVIKGDTVQFTDASHGGSMPYSAWSWDLNGDSIEDSTIQNPTHIYTTAGDYNVKLKVTGYYACCESATVTKTIHVYATPPPPPVGGEWVPTNTIQILARLMASASLIAVIAAGFVYGNRRRRL